MAKEFEIRADYDEETIVIYQAYPLTIADPAIKEQRFVSPFSFCRMTWIKPSFLWLMHRSHWGHKSGQERTLAVRIRRSGWDKALSLGVLTHPEQSVYPIPGEWDEKFKNAQVHIQWETERTLRGDTLNHDSLQVGISRHLIREFVDEWIVSIQDVSQTVVKIHQLLKTGHEKNAKRLLPPERVYPVDPQIGKRILIE